MNLKIHITDKAKSSLKKLPKKALSDVSHDILSLEKDYFPDGHRIKKIKAVKDFYRLRSGNYRIIFYIEEPYIVIVIVVDRKDGEKTLKSLF